MFCPKCQSENPDKAKFCNECATPLKDKEMGSNQDTIEIKGERKHATVLFSDLSGYTAMTEKMDPEDVKSLMGDIFKRAGKIVEKYEGTVERFFGDEIMVLFGVPKAHEDDPIKAIHVATEIHKLVESLDPEFEKRNLIKLKMHTGINSGLVITGDEYIGKDRHGLTGDTINLAKRLTNLAKPGEIIAGPNTYKMVKQFFNFQMLKPVNVKGKKGLLNVYKVLSKKSIDFNKRTNTFFLGRDEELLKLNILSNQLVQDGIGSMVSIIGDPGIGKSRLVDEYKKQFLNTNILWIESRSSSYLQETSYGTFLEVLKNYVGIKDSDDDVKGWEKLEEKLMHLFPDGVHDTLPYLATLLSLKVKGNLYNKVQFIDGDVLKGQIYRAFFILLKRLTYDQPLIIEFEDFHWADQSTIDLLAHLIPIVHEVPLILLFISRNTKNGPASKLRRLLQKEHNEDYAKIFLTSLSKEKILDLACKNLNIDSISSQLSGLIHRKCEGNPLYLEELIRTLNHNDLIVKSETTEQYTLKPLSGKVSIPDTLRGIVESSIDRLDEDMKDLLKIASVIGRNFLYRLLEAIGDSRKDLDNNLSILIGENLISQKVGNPELEYYFYHDLIRDAAYDTILLKHRKKLHRSVGEAIESIFHDQIERFYGLLSYHFAKAYQWNKAQKYLIKAGDQANRIAGDSEALSHYKKAMSAHEQLFGDKIDDLEKAVYQRKLGEIYFRRGEHDKSLVSLKQAFKLLGIFYPLGKWQTRGSILHQLIIQITKRVFSVFNKKMNITKLNRHEEEVIKIYEVMIWIDFCINQERLAFDTISVLNYAEKIGSRSRTIQGYSGMGLLLDTIGLPFIAHKYHNLSMQQIETIDEELIRATAYLCLGYHLKFQGKWEDALASFETAAGLYKGIGHLKKWGNAKTMIVFVLNYQGQFARSFEISQKIVQMGTESGDLQLKGYGLSGIGLNQITMGPLDKAVLNLKEGLKLLKSIPDYYALADFSIYLARCYRKQGELQTAHAILKETEKMIIEKNFQGFVVSMLYNALAETYLSLFESSIEVSENITIGKLKKYILKTTKYAKHFKCGQPKAFRLIGSFYWLKGDHKNAHKFWKNSLNICHELGCRNEEGLIYSDMGKRINDITFLKKARDIFVETGANLDLTHARTEIKKLV